MAPSVPLIGTNAVTHYTDTGIIMPICILPQSGRTRILDSLVESNSATSFICAQPPFVRYLGWKDGSMCAPEEIRLARLLSLGGDELKASYTSSWAVSSVFDVVILVFFPTH